MFNNYYGDPTSFGYKEYMARDEAEDLRNKFRLLWEQHVYWTRMVILSIAFASPDLSANTNRLLRNPTDFARVFRRYYGKAVANEFERLLRDHLDIAAELVTAAKNGNTKVAADAEKRWYANADEIVRFLRKINPYWRVKEMRAMWYKHLALTKQEAVTILEGNYEDSIAVFDQIEKEALKMADEFACGIIEQFDL